MSAAARKARDADLDGLVACLASAFFEDPVWGRWSFPQADERPAALLRLLGFWTRAAARHGWCWVAERAGAPAAGAVWVPPGTVETTPEDDAAFGPLVAELFGARAGEANELFEAFERNHPEVPHYYLSLLGTDRAHAGAGIGTSLLEANLALIDTEGVPAYLESTNPVNLARYEALGFEPRAEFGPAGGPVITTMWRAAR